MTPQEKWNDVRTEIQRRIAEEMAAKPGESLFMLEAAEGDMTELGTMLRVIDRIMGVEPQDWDQLLVDMLK